MGASRHPENQLRTPRCKEVAARHPAAKAIMSNETLGRYPLLEAILSAKGLPDRGIWKICDVAQIFDVGVRSIYDWVNNKKLTARDLPGHGKFLSQDLEEFLTSSRRLPKGLNGSRGEQ